ncbi:MAG TPA: O-antigen ligase family protein [Acidobacteriaceae bacterium]|nr:O-antigen ligase family protein [Acidobacteriaceae bacterium]
MGFVLTILYVLTYYLTPTVMFGSLAEYRIELILAGVIVIVSLPALSGSSVGKTAQLPALIGLAFATFMSMLIGASWAGGGVTAVLLFIPNAFAYLLVCLHCTTKRKVQIVILMMLFVCLFVIGQGAIELRHGLPQGAAAHSTDMSGSYFLGMSNEHKQWFYRLRGQGQINDPNDFAQLIICVLPLMFFFWQKKKKIRNFVFVLVPVGLLLWGAFLTHSRGSILALMAVVIVALRKKIGTVPSIILAAVLFAGASAAGYTGGRDISASAGEDRTELWGDGLQLLKAHPLFGIGFGNMTDAIGKTAHNTIVVCAAELGLCGLFFWSMFLFPSVRDSFVVAWPKNIVEKKPVVLSDNAFALPPPGGAAVPDEADIRRLARLLVLSFTGFMVTGWFLSRAFVLTLFLLGGLAEVAFQMALQRGMVSPRLPLGRVLRYSGVMTIGFILVMYITLRIVNLTH